MEPCSPCLQKQEVPQLVAVFLLQYFCPTTGGPSQRTLSWSRPNPARSNTDQQISIKDHHLTGVWASDDRVVVTPLRNATLSSTATLFPVTVQPMGKVMVSDITVDRADFRGYS